MEIVTVEFPFTRILKNGKLTTHTFLTGLTMGANLVLWEIDPMCFPNLSPYQKNPQVVASPVLVG